MGVVNGKKILSDTLVCVLLDQKIDLVAVEEFWMAKNEDVHEILGLLILEDGIAKAIKTDLTQEDAARIILLL